MKKKLLTILFTVLFICMLTLIVSAKTVVFVETIDNGDGTTTETELYRYETNGTSDYPIISHEGIGFDKYDDEGDALTWYATTTIYLESGEVKYPVTKAKTKNLIVDDGDGILMPSEIGQINNLVSVTFDDDCKITEFAGEPNRNGLFYRDGGQAKYFLFIDVPDSVITISDNCFRNAFCMLEISLSENSKLTDFGAATFYGCTSMKSIYIPKGVTEFRTIDEAGEQYYDYGLFKNCQKLESIIFAEDSQLESIGKCTFNECYSLKSITFPNSLKRVYPRQFNKCNALEYVNFGASLETFDRTGDTYMSLFYNASNVKTVILPATFKAENLASDLHATFPYTGVTIYYAGTEAEFIKLQEKFALATTSPGNAGITKATYNYISPCEAFYGGAHNISTAIEYESFLAAGTKIVGCINNGCNEKETIALPALFTCLGYSAPEADGDVGVAIKYKVHFEAIEAYEQETGETVSYGLYAATQKAIGDNDILDANGTPADGVLKAEINNDRFVFISLKMMGFSTEESKNAKFAIGAYVETTKGDKKEYAYLQEGTPAAGEKYCFIAFNDFIE